MHLGPEAAADRGHQHADSGFGEIEGLGEAGRLGAQLMVIRLDTPGGLVTSTRDIVKAIFSSEVPVAVFVAPGGARAASAGTFITMSAHIAAMAPGTNIGAAHPVSVGGQMDKEMSKKVTNDAAAYMRTIAEKRRRNVQWAEDAVRKSVSATEKEALRLGVIDLISESLDDLLKAVDGRQVQTAKRKLTLHTKEATVRTVEMTLRDKILKIISDPTIAYILLLLGLAGLYFELSNPGAILPGVLGAIFLILAFWAFQTLPINYAGLLLILLAIVFFILEIKVVSHGLLTIGGIASFILGSLMLVQSPAPFLRISLWAILGAAAATTAFFALVAGMGIKALKRRPTTGWEALIGEVGVARTPLHPDGQVFIQGELWSASCEEGAEVGEKVRVVAVEGLKLHVTKVPKEALHGTTSGGNP